MSSTNKTANLGLNQWVASDTFQMADFNADNARIDAAVADLRQGMSRVKLFDITVTEAGSPVTLDFSDVDLGQFIKLEMYFSIAKDFVCMRINGISSNSYRFSEGSINDTMDYMQVMTGTSSMGVNSRCYYRWSDCMGRYESLSRKVCQDELKALEISGSGSYTLSVGDRIIVWGVKL